MYVYITILMIMFLSYRNPSTDLHCKWRDCFLFEQNIAINRLIIRVGYFPSIAFNETQICVLPYEVFPFSRFLSINQTFCFCLSGSVYLFYFHSFCVFIPLICFRGSRYWFCLHSRKLPYGHKTYLQDKRLEN